MQSTIEFSAQFGGSDAAESVLPHFRVLKKTSKEFSINSFPFDSLAFILRVDGVVNSYGLQGCGNLDFDNQVKQYLSIDIGIPDSNFLSSDEEIADFIGKSIRSSVRFLEQSKDTRLKEIDFEKLAEKLDQFCEAYESIIYASRNKPVSTRNIECDSN